MTYTPQDNLRRTTMTTGLHKFSVPLQQGEDPETGLAVFGFEYEDVFIHDPFSSECGRFQVDPPEAYAITWEDAEALKKLNKALAETTEAAITAGCKSFQDAVGITSGDVAGMHFSDKDSARSVSKAMADYIQFELQQAGSAVT